MTETYTIRFSWLVPWGLVLIATLISAPMYSQTCSPVCRSLNLSVHTNAEGDNYAFVGWNEVLTRADCAIPFSYTLYNTYGGIVLSGNIDDLGVTPGLEIQDPCRYLGGPVRLSVSNAMGTCESELTFKENGLPALEGAKYHLYCLEPEVTDIEAYLNRFYNGGNPDLYEAGVDVKDAAIPCRGLVSTEFVRDWVEHYPCLPGADTAKIIFREFEVFTKDGNRASVFDTLIVYRLPEITLSNIYCAEKDTTYCGVSENFGPYMVAPGIDSVTGMPDGTCDTLYFTVDDPSAKCAIASPATFDPKCGISVSVGCWEFPDDCAPQYKVTIEIKQTCWADDLGGMCVVAPPAAGPGTPNAFEEISEGYWRCEYWVIDLDTLPPYSAVKYDKLQEQNLIPSSYADLDDYDTEYHCFETPISSALTSSDHYQPIIVVPTTTHDCAGHTYIPPVCAYEDWSGLKQVKARIIDYHRFVESGYTEHVDLNIGGYVADATGEACDFFHDPPIAPDHGYCYEFHDAVKLPKSEYPYVVFYEIMDSCHLIDTIYAYMLVKDRTKPVAVADKGVTVSLSSKKVWVDAETFDEGSWDNCGINFLLARRSDWYEACIDLCDDVYWCAAGPHGDTLYYPHLEDDKDVDEVEAYYAKTLQWLWDDGQECASIIYNAWLYDLMKYATLYCVDHPYPVDNHYFRDLFQSAYYYYDSGKPADEKDHWYYNEDHDCFDKFHYIPEHPGFGCGLNGIAPPLNGGVKHLSALEAEVDLYEQIGGGWADAVPFDCDDACGPVTVEILAMDYWCNWSKAWTTVWVEDKTPISIEKDVYDTEITCATYKSARYGYGDEIHPVSLEYIVEKAKAGEQTAFDALDAILGGYCKAWVDPYGNYVDEDGEEIDCDIDFYDSICYCTTYHKEIKVYDDHLGYIWKDSMYTECYYADSLIHLQKGIVAVNCAENVQCKQEVWCEFDHCGQGVIYRKWKIWQGCPPEEGYASNHIPDTITRTQRIWVGNQCELSKYMFDIPYDQTVYACGIDYDPDGSGNVVGAAGHEYTGYPEYKFDDDCRIVGIAHEDKVFKVVGGDEGCYKIVRTWYFADWCGGKPVDPYWWKDREGTYFSCEQKILVIDTLPPACVITGPVGDGETIEASGCTYDFMAQVDVEDSCGVVQYFWELKNASAQVAPVAQAHGELVSGESTFDVVVDQLSGGTYSLNVRVTDDCQNESFCQYTFTVTSVKKPSPVCITSMTVDLIPWDIDGDGVVDTATATVPASIYNSSSAAPCGYEDSELQFYIEWIDGVGDDQLDSTDHDSLALGCSDLGMRTVRLWVYHPDSDTEDYCDLILIVQNNMGGCRVTPPVFSNLSGSILTEDAIAIPSVDISIWSGMGMHQEATSDNEGAYALQFAMGDSLTLNLRKEDQVNNGVTTADILPIFSHIRGTPLSSPYLRLAADVTGDGVIAADDLLEVRSVVLGTASTWSGAPVWRFVPSDFVFQSDTPEAEDYKGAFSVMMLQEDVVKDFVGVKMGDVTLDRSMGSAGRMLKAVIAEIKDVTIHPGETLSVPLSIPWKDLRGMQFALRYDTSLLELASMNTVEGLSVDELTFGWSLMYPGHVRASWINDDLSASYQEEAMFELKFRGKNTGVLSDHLTLQQGPFSSEVYTGGGEVKPLALRFLNEAKGMSVFQNVPNPFHEYTLLPFELDQEDEVTITVADVTGREIYRHEAWYPAGSHTLMITSETLNVPGLYYYTAANSYTSSTKKMVWTNE